MGIIISKMFYSMIPLIYSDKNVLRFWNPREDKTKKQNCLRKRRARERGIRPYKGV